MYAKSRTMIEGNRFSGSFSDDVGLSIRAGCREGLEDLDCLEGPVADSEIGKSFTGCCGEELAAGCDKRELATGADEEGPAIRLDGGEYAIAFGREETVIGCDREKSAICDGDTPSGEEAGV